MAQERSGEVEHDPTPDTATMEISAHAGELSPGQKLGPYEIAEKIGQGGMGVVYRAIDTRLKRAVAIKVIGRERSNGRKRFFLEAKAASALNHPNIVTIYEYHSEGVLDYIVMEYLEGETLGHLGAARTPLPDVIRYACQAASAVERAHRAGIVHRDLKPGNIMVTGPSDEPGAVKVLDFGLAKQAMDSSTPEAAETLTRTGVAVGTPAYMSPEEAKGEPADYRSDIFSFGIILYELVGGRRPFQGANALSLLHSIAHEAPPPLAGVPRPLATLIEDCLAKDKAARPQSMKEVRDRLMAVLPQVDSVEPRPAAGRRAAKAAAAVACVGLMAAPAWWFANRGAPLPRRILTVAVEAQKPGAPPYDASASEIFRSGDRFRLRIESPQPGFLYIINQGAGENGAQRLWVLYPPSAPTQPEPPNHRFETGWYDFDANPGAERLWTLWAERPLAPIDEALRSGDSGEVGDGPGAAKLQSLLAGMAPAKMSEASSNSHALRLTSDQPTLASLVELRHQ